MDELEKEKRLDFLCDQLADCRDINLTDKTIELIEEVIQITNTDFIEKYDCFVGKDLHYWGINDGWDVNYYIALYYNYEAKTLFARKAYKKAMMFLHFADYHASKNHYSIKSDYYDLVIKCNKGFCLLKTGDISAASICFSNINSRYKFLKDDFKIEYDVPPYNTKPQECTLLNISMSLGMAVTYLKLGKIQEAEKLLIKISKETHFSQDDEFYDNFIFKIFAIKTALAEMYHLIGDDQKALEKITDAVSNLHCHYYISDSATYMLDLVKKQLEEQDKPTNLDELLSLMYDAHIHRDSYFYPPNVDRLFV